MKERFSYSTGKMVRVKVGAFQNFTGRIEEVDQEKATVKVLVSIFGRTEPIELGFLEVEKVTFREEQ